MKFVLSVVLSVLFLISGCATSTQTFTANPSDILSWRGRLALRIESGEKNSLTAGFELAGNAVAGELKLFTPLGSTAAALSWSEHTAQMRSNGELQSFDSLDALIKQAVGTELPVAALFAWLAGDNMSAAGWHADLSQQANGRITARRLRPPVAELRLVLDK